MTAGTADATGGTRQTKAVRSVKVKIHVKGSGRRQSRIAEIVYDYPLAEMSAEEFLAETVRQTVRAYNERGKERMPDREELLRLFADMSAREEELREKAQTGKVTYTAWQEEWQKKGHRADEKKAVRDALQAFEDGIVAVFVDGVRYTDPAQMLRLTPETEAVFMRLTFLAGRIW